MNCASDKSQSKWQIAGPKINESLRQVESKIFKGNNQNDTPNHEHNPKHNAMFRKDHTTVVGRLLTLRAFVEDSFIKIGSGIAYSEKLRAFVDSIPEELQKKNANNLFIDGFSGSKKCLPKNVNLKKSPWLKNSTLTN